MADIEKDKKFKDSLENDKNKKENNEGNKEDKDLGKLKFDLSQLKEQIIAGNEKKEIQNTESSFAKNETPQKNKENIQEVVPPKNIQEIIQGLNRPEAEVGLLQAYTDMEKNIKDSPNDKNPIASTLGKIINLILNA